MIDCLLINSPDSLHSSHYLADPKLPLGLLSIAGYLRSNGFRVQILDFHSTSYSEKELHQNVSSLDPRIIGLNITTPNRSVVYDIACKLKHSCPNTPIIVGGPHASCLPGDILVNAPEIDGVVLGEGEEVLLQVMNSLPTLKPFQGFWTHDSHTHSSHANLAPRILSLDSLPFPAYDLIDVQKYIAVSPELYISGSRGCKYNCVFCCSRNLLGRQVIFRSAENVKAEIDFVCKQYQVQRFYFYDDNILSWPELDIFCNLLSEQGIFWTAQANINDLTPKIVPNLSSSGCYRLSFGLESGSREIQRYVGKVIKHDAISKIATLRKHNIHSRAFFIVGFPQETLEQICETARYILDLAVAGLSDIAIFPARPYPGTRMLHDCILLFGEDNFDQLLDFIYLEDHKNESDTWIKEKLFRYNTIPAFSINRSFNNYSIRKIIRSLYNLFHSYSDFSHMTLSDIKEYVLLNTQQ